MKWEKVKAIHNSFLSTEKEVTVPSPQNTKHSILLVKTSDIYFVSSNGFILTTVFPLVAKIYWDEL